VSERANPLNFVLYNDTDVEIKAIYLVEAPAEYDHTAPEDWGEPFKNTHVAAGKYAPVAFPHTNNDDAYWMEHRYWYVKIVFADRSTCYVSQDFYSYNYCYVSNRGGIFHPQVAPNFYNLILHNNSGKDIFGVYITAAGAADLEMQYESDILNGESETITGLSSKERQEIVIVFSDGEELCRVGTEALELQKYTAMYVYRAEDGSLQISLH